MSEGGNVRAFFALEKAVILGVLVVSFGVLSISCRGGEAIMAFKVESPAFANGEKIPQKYTCEGKDISPELGWEGAPSGTKSFVLIMDDPDAPRGTFVHWVLFDISATESGLAEGSKQGKSGRNDFGRLGYGGPCPPKGHGVHRYFFKLYALDTPSLGLAEGVSKAEVEKAMKGHILAQAEMMGRYER